MDERLLECLINREHVVLGRALLPFCLWHVVNLERIRSPLISALPQPIELPDLALAVRICASSIDTPMREINPPQGAAAQAFYRDLLPYRFAVEQESAKFRAFRADYLAPPRRMDTEGGKPMSSPWEMVYLARLCRYGRMTWKEAWMFPFGLGLHFTPALMEVGGAEVSVINEDRVRGWKKAGYTDEDIARMEAAQR